MDSSEGMRHSAPFVVSVFLVLAIIVVVSPLWASLKTALLRFIGRAKLGVWVLLAICLFFILREYIKQRHFGVSSLSSAEQSDDFSDEAHVDSLFHQRNMYIFAIPAILAAILIILLSFLPGFVQELNDLLEQIEVKQQTAGTQ
jgi:hypothetical protein